MRWYVYMSQNSPGERKRPSDWMKKKSSHVPFLRDPFKYDDKETCRIKVWERFARQTLAQRAGIEQATQTSRHKT